MFLIPSVLAVGPAALAMETDQFTTPHAPLYDIGPILSRKIVEILESDRTGRDPERVLSDWIGANIFESRLVRWVKAGGFELESTGITCCSRSCRIISTNR